jgi:hypothetical protein
MCSGDGVCTDPVLQVENDLGRGEDVEFELYAQSCTSVSGTQFPVRDYDTFGASPWENIPDVLRMYGMCSYRDWFEYLEFVDPSEAKRKNQGACGVNSAEDSCDPASFDAYRSVWWNTGQPFASTSMPTLYDTRKFLVKPHPCDKDYQHLERLRGCAPVVNARSGALAAAVVSHAGLLPQSLEDLETEEQVADAFSSGAIRREFPATVSGTLAQTLRRDGYINMQGRPPFDYSASSPMRSSGFLSYSNALVSERGDSIFQSCSTVRQCFKDTFTFRGEERTRRVFVRGDAIQATGIASYMRDWSPEDAAKCGIFGVWISDGKGKGVNRMCPGTSDSTHYCCQVDMAAVPLHYLFTKFPAVLAQLSDVCNSDPILTQTSTASSSYIIFNSGRIRSVTQQVGEFYAIPKTSVTKSVRVYTNLLNELLSEFTPPSTTIPSSKAYVQMIDCSVALYDALQTNLACGDGGVGPFCTQYHAEATTASAGSAIGDAPRLARIPSLYFLLPNTMQEFPYAWWHKCVMLAGRTIRSDEESIECVEWRQDTISEADMLSRQGLYDDQDVRSILRRIEGGVTSAAVQQASQALWDGLRAAFAQFSTSGAGGPATSDPAVAERIKQQGTPGGKIVFDGSAMQRMGAPRSFNMKCYARTFIPNNVTEFMAMGRATTGRKCALNMIMWIKNENADFRRYNPTVSEPAYGKPGIHEECFVLREKDLVTLEGSSQLKSVLQYIQERLEGDAVEVGAARAETTTVFGGSVRAATSLISRGIEAADFLENRFNSKDGGLLAVEYVPPKIDGLPTGQKDFSSVTGSMTTDMEGFASYLSDTPCVTLQHLEPELPPCLPKKTDPVKLEDQHCEDAYQQARADVIEYAERIEAIPTMDKTLRYPQPPQHCVWDCGGTWDGYERPTHAGLDNATRASFLSQLTVWKTTCLSMVREQRYCLRKQGVGSIRDAVDEGSSRQYFQEVCSAKEFSEVDGFVFDVYRAFGGKGNIANIDGINEFTRSIFDDRTSRAAAGAFYTCDRIKVRSSGSTVVDRVRTALSYNDIVVSQNEDLIKGQESRLQEFNMRVYHLITSEVLNIVESECNAFGDRCIPSARKHGEPDSSRKIDPTFFRQDNRSCLVLGVVTGNIDCKFWLRDGLDADIAVVSRLNNRALTSPVRGKAANWEVYTSDLPDPTEAHTRSYAHVVRTLYTRFMDMVASNATLSARWIKPVPLSFFQHDDAYRRSFLSFSLVRKLKIEEAIEKKGNDCEGNSTIIQYDRCSPEFNALWKHSGKNVEAHVRQSGPMIVPSKSTLIWPGLSWAHHMADAVPAWSLHARNESEVFARWIFDQDIQCKMATVDTTVCADVSISTSEKKIESVIPWLGGDYNPW